MIFSYFLERNSTLVLDYMIYGATLFNSQPRRWVQAPSLIEKETSEGLVSYECVFEKK
jgi:hypothetical protein